MLATFVIGLREGLEAALIVGIIAAFLRNNGRSLAAMWWGVGLAMVLSLAVGIGLDLVEQALPQAAQEGMETVIGGIAIFFVTGMIAWMNTHARNMKRELEAQAAEALSHRGAFALAAMAFLAVLKEGFETAVFLLATFSAAQSAALAASGAVLGILLAILIGWGIYLGGVKINLSRFFRVTGAFLILVAAGLVISALRTAHEAGWLNAGQQMTVNLSWLVAPGTVQSALITGVLGMPTDPRLVELLGWFAYLIPVSLYVYWPQKHRPSARGARRLRLAIGAGLILAAALLAGLYPVPQPALPQAAPLAQGGTAQFAAAEQGRAGTLLVTQADGRKQSLPLPAARAVTETHDGVAGRAWHLDATTTPAEAPATLTLDAVVQLAGRIPMGLNAAQHPGPYQARWTQQTSTHVWVADGVLQDARQSTTTILALSGSGLASPRIVSLRGDAAAKASWAVSPAYAAEAAAALQALPRARGERRFWAVQLPVLLALAGLLTLFLAAIRPAHAPRLSDRRSSTKESPYAAE
ncbi:iron uptake transporter permease EfeU [Acidisoma sp. 7E03]